jgi:hypothetical protein
LYFKKTSEINASNVRMPNKAFSGRRKPEINVKLSRRKRPGLLPTLIADLDLFTGNVKGTHMGISTNLLHHSSNKSQTINRKQPSLQVLDMDH